VDCGKKPRKGPLDYPAHSGEGLHHARGHQPHARALSANGKAPRPTYRDRADTACRKCDNGQEARLTATLVSLLTWNNLGLCFDIAGVVLLAYALVSQSDKHLLAKAQTDWAYNTIVARDLCEQRADAAIGTAYMIAGFVLQLFASVLPQSPIGVILFGAAAVLVTCLYFFWARRQLVSHAVERLAALDWEQFPPPSTAPF
jgi:hypothetical protein